MHTISYISECRAPVANDATALRTLLAASRRRNQTMGVTGALLLRGDVFLQTLEGPSDSVRDVFASILADARHTNIYVLFDEPCQDRRFAEWSLEGFFDPQPNLDFQATLHRLGEHFCDCGSYSPVGLSLYLWKCVADMADCRMRLAPTLTTRQVVTPLQALAAQAQARHAGLRPPSPSFSD